MSSTAQPTLEELFEQALSLRGKQREVFLETCSDDPTIRAELASLLAATEKGVPFFDSLARAVISLSPWDEVPAGHESASDPLIGRSLRQYCIEEKLGSGGMGVVYRTHDTRLDRAVALKFLPPHLGANEAAKERFLVEARAAAGLDHTNLCAIHEIGEDEDGRLFIAMAYYEGETVKEILARGPLEVDEAMNLAAQAASGLAVAHARGIVHRDIKPGNLMVTEGGVLKILDFGLAKTAEASLTEAGMRLGTPAYMSPEQTRGEEITQSTDLWSLGVVLYELLTGQRPFRGERNSAVIHAIRHEEPRPPSELREGVPPEVEELVLGLLSKDPEARKGPAERRLAMPVDTTLSPPTPSRILPALFVPSRRKALIGASGAAVLLAAAVGLVFLRGGPSLVPNRIAVAPFEDRTEDPEFAELGDLAAEWITRGISKLAVLEVTPASMAREAWVAPGDEGSDRVQALAERTTAASVVVGSYSLIGRRLRFQAEIIDAGTGELITTLDPVTGAADSATAVVGTLAERAAAAVALHFDAELEWVTYLSNPPSLEAFREYKKCLDLYMRAEFERAIEHCDASWGLDSMYASPILWSAFAHANLGRLAQPDSLMRRVQLIRDRLTAMEAAVTDYLRANLTGDLEAAVRAADELFRLHPARWAYGVAYQANRTNRPGRAVEVFPLADLAVRANWKDYWSVYANAYHMLGDHQQELETARRGRERHPRSLSLLNTEVIALAALGRVDDANALVKEGFAIPPEPGWVPGGFRTAVAALEYRAHGHPAAARAAIDRAIEWYRSRSVEEADPYDRGRVLYWGERWDEARTVFDSLLAANPDNINYLGYLGTTLARLGNRDHAIAIDSQLAASDHSVSPFEWGLQARWRAHIAAVLGEKERAVRLLRQAYREGSAYDITLHRDIDFENLRDYAPFEDFMRPRR